MHALATLIDTVISIYIYVLIASALMSWLTSFNIINVHNRFVFTVISFLYRVTEPALRPIRRVIPNLGGIDISPVVLILVLWFVRDLILEYLLREV